MSVDWFIFGEKRDKKHNKTFRNVTEKKSTDVHKKIFAAAEDRLEKKFFSVETRYHMYPCHQKYRFKNALEALKKEDSVLLHNLVAHQVFSIYKKKLDDGIHVLFSEICKAYRDFLIRSQCSECNTERLLGKKNDGL